MTAKIFSLKPKKGSKNGFELDENGRPIGGHAVSLAGHRDLIRAAYFSNV